MSTAPDGLAFEVELFAADHARPDAAGDPDPAALNAVLAEEFASALVDLCDPPSGRADWITNVLTRLAVDTFQYEALRVHASGDVAVVQARYRQRGRICGKPRGDRFTVTDLWLKRDDRWQVATRSVGRTDPDYR